MTNDPAIQFSDISFGYGTTPLVHDLSLNVHAGRITALCGPNGSGKSTLLKLATHLLRPSQGHVAINGTPVANIGRTSLARQVASLPQSPSAPSELSVSELVMLGRFAHRRGFASASSEDHAKVADAITQTDLDGFTNTPIGNLSGGQRQRAWVAMTLAQDAPILLLDEPTNHLDIAHSLEVMDLLRRLVKTQNKTVVIVLHDINLAASFADDIVFLKDGCVTSAGPHETVMQKDIIEHVFGISCKLHEGSERGRIGVFPMLAQRC
ncbi:ABC transporter ATP-binding protein [Parasulfitobacter algicola]|uniref:ABC transporter ATP-binding protein n=1 Tax=Parasulfitobacter algicola TaxID=2614809 RepID=A0ABX2J073_9RHOB|nr:ABC transporter ATP-binding protein [Sulfitobacter algicola]NSX57007.1 ABC transporter ATP-binding protein [Sulfitobacter algicola]